MAQDSPDLDDTVDALLATLAGQRASVEQDPHATIEPPRPSGADSGGMRAVEMLGEVGAFADGSDGKLRIGRTLGEGGMGIVHLAEQVALGRQVAVKTLREARQDEATRVKLLREAWVTGALEHPNVVPVYDLGLDVRGLPVIVLKRIEGVEWSTLMGDAERVAATFGAMDLLEWNLHILMQVCNALHFAHTRGIVHRDIKPENVMIGEFGEVYVLDWGIAVSLHDDGTGRFPLASAATEMAGTPCYMAPEMFGGSEEPLTPRTDVYLLGATLYEILTGKPPHDEESLVQIVRSAVLSDPPFPPEAPAELVAACKRAMAPEPEDRWASAEELRLALQAFLEHRSSAALAAEARRRLHDLEREVKRPSSGDRESGPEDPSARLYDLFGECRFGFQQALRAWSGNEPAREGLRRAVVLMVEHELAQDEPKAAARLLAELDDPPPDLTRAVERARREDEARRRDLEELGRALDPHVGKRTRTFISALLGAMWTLAPLVAGAFMPDLIQEERQLLTVAGVSLGVILGLGLWARDSLSKTLINRRIFGTAVFLMGAQIVLIGGTSLMDLPLATVRTLAVFSWLVVACMVALYLDPRFWIVGAGYLGAFFACAAWPEHFFWITAAANLNLTVMIVIFSRNLPRYALPSDPFR